MSRATRSGWPWLVVTVAVAASLGYAVGRRQGATNSLRQASSDEPASLGEAAAGRAEGTGEGAMQERDSERLPGLWHRLRRQGAEAVGLDAGAAEALADLPYLSGYEVASGVGGVTVHDRARAYEGLNLVVSGHAPEALLVDMGGHVLHRWSRTLDSVWPQMAASRDLEHFDTFWRRARLLRDGELLAIFDGIGLVKLDVDSELLWAFDGRAHHDVRVAPDGTVYTLTRRRRREYPALDLDGPIEEDFVTRLTADGEPIDHLSILDALASSDYSSLLVLARRKGDILHTNTVERLDGRFTERHDLYREGNLLVSIPRLNTVAVIDPAEAAVVWALTGMFRFQHQPTVVETGRILVFDNTGENGNSKVVEIDPMTQEIEWAYRGTAERPLSSYFLGSCQRLPNGNTLITESTAGRGLEVTPQGDIVWEFVNPFRAGDDDDLIASLLEVVRIDPRELAPEFLAHIGLDAVDHR